MASTILTVTTFPQTFSTGNWPVTRMNGGKWHLRWTPSNASSDAQYPSDGNFRCLVASNDDGGIWIVNDQLRIYNNAGGGTLLSATTLVWTAGAQIDLTFNLAAGYVDISGVSSGGGRATWTPSGTVFGGATLGVGIYGGGGFPLPTSTISSFDDAVVADSMTALAGSYAISGVAAGLIAGLVLPAAAGSYAITGVDADVGNATVNDTLTAASGSFAITGTDATPRVGYGLSCSPGSFAIAGVDADLVGGNVVTISVGDHGIDFQLYGHAIRPASVALDVEAGSLIVLGTGGRSSDIAGGVTDDDGNSYTDIDGIHDYPDFAGYGTSVLVARAANTVSLATSQDVTTFDENSTVAVEVRGGKQVSDFAWSQHANAGAGPTQTSGSVTTGGPAVIVALWWGSAPVGQDHTAVPDDSDFEILEQYVTNDNDGYVQVVMAAAYKPNPGTYAVTWSHTPTQGAQLWMVAVEGDTALDAEPGEILITGVDAAVPVDYALVCDPGDFAITGVAAGVPVGRGGAAAAGAVAITGTAAALTGSLSMSADAGAFAITGSDAALPRALPMTADAGAIAITGVNAAPLLGRGLPAAAGAIAIDGVDADLIYTAGDDNATHYSLTADPGAVAIAGVASTLQIGRGLSAAPGAIAITGIPADLGNEIDVPGFRGGAVIDYAAGAELGENHTAAEVPMGYEIVQGDREPDMLIDLTINGASAAAALSQTDTFELRIKAPDGTVRLVPLELVDLPTARVRRVWDVGDTDVPGYHSGQVVVTDVGGRVQTFPSSGSLVWVVAPQL